MKGGGREVEVARRREVRDEGIDSWFMSVRQERWRRRKVEQKREMNRQDSEGEQELERGGMERVSLPAAI